MKIFLFILIFAASGVSYSQNFIPKNLSDISSKDYLKQLDNQIFASYTYIHNLGRFGDYYKDGSGGYINYGKYFPNSWLAVARTGYIKQNLRPGLIQADTRILVFCRFMSEDGFMFIKILSCLISHS